MKILETLKAVLLKMGDKEVEQFRQYAMYKKKKIHLNLFNFILKNKDKEIDHVKINNIRSQSNGLYQLLLNFWTDNAPQDDLSLQVDQLMHGSTVLLNKGLLREGVDLQMEAAELAKSGELFYSSHEILKSSFYWSSILHPQNVFEILESSQKNEAFLRDRMKRMYDATINSLDVHFKSINEKFNNKELSQHFYKETIEEISELLQEEGCSIRTKILYHDTLTKVYSVPPSGNWEMMNYHREELIRNAELIDKTDPNYFKQTILLNTINLVYDYFSLKKIPEFQIYLAKFRMLVNDQIGRDKTQEYYLYEIELLNCNLLNQYENAEKLYIPKALKFLEKHENKIPFGLFCAIFSLCFEHYISVGDLEKARQFLEKMQQEDKQSKLNFIQKYLNKLYELLFHYDLNNFELVENKIGSIRRLYSAYLKKNQGGKVILKYLLKLSRTENEIGRIPIYHAFKSDLKETSKSYHYSRIMGINIIFDWIDAKISKSISIQAHIRNKSDT